MIVKKDYTALVILVIFLLGGACLLGVSLTQTEVLNPSMVRQKAQSNAMFDGVKVQDAQAASQATQQVMVATSQYEGLVGRLTEIPLQRTVRAANQLPTQDVLRITATAQAQDDERRRAEENFISQQQYEQQRKDQEAAQAQINNIAQYGGMVLVVVFTGIVAYLAHQASAKVNSEAKARVYEAEAKAMAEKRRLEEMRIAIRNSKFGPELSKTNGQVRTAVFPVRELNEKQ